MTIRSKHMRLFNNLAEYAFDKSSQNKRTIERILDAYPAPCQEWTHADLELPRVSSLAST